MTWVKLDDGFAGHPKIIGLSDRAFRVHIRALCYCAKYSPGVGSIPASALAEMGATKAVVEALVEAAVWDRDEHGALTLHDFSKYHPKPGSTAEKAEAGRLGGIASGEARRSKREAETKHSASALLEANGSSRVDAGADPDPIPTRPDPGVSIETPFPSQGGMADEAFGSVMTALFDVGLTPGEVMCEQVKFRLDSGVPAGWLVEAIRLGADKDHPWGYARKIVDGWVADGKPSARRQNPVPSGMRGLSLDDPNYVGPDLATIQRLVEAGEL